MKKPNQTKPEPVPTFNELSEYRQLCCLQKERQALAVWLYNPEEEINEIWQSKFSEYSALGHKIEALENRMSGGWKGKAVDIHPMPVKVQRTHYN